MHKVFGKSIAIYLSTLRLNACFGIFIILSLLFLPMLAGYVNVGGNFVRFGSLYTPDMTALQAAALIGLTVVGLFCTAFFLSALISIVKLRETLDHFGFSKVMAVFPRYILRIAGVLGLLTVLSIAVGTALDFLAVHHAVAQLIIACLWLPFIFAPQILVIEDLGIKAALVDSVRFAKKMPHFLVAYVLLGLVLLMALALVETALGQFFVWEHKLVSIVLVSLVILPFLNIFGTELYILRYPVTKV